MDKLNKSKKILISVVVVVLLLITTLTMYTLYLSSKVQKHTISKNDTDLGISKEFKEKIDSNPDIKNITNIALFGVDSPDDKNENGRSDSIMILTVDNVHNKLKLTSIMRDSYVNISNHGMDKINHAYSFGGPELAINTLNSNFDLNITDYAMVNFSTLPQIIDKLGGVDINIKDYEIPSLSTYGIYSPGEYTLNGEQALTYCRIRYNGNGDYERTERHRAVLNSLFEKFKEQNVADYMSLADTILPLVKTSLSTTEIIKTGEIILTSGMKNLEQERFPTDEYSSGKIIDDVFYLTFDEENVKDQIHKYIFEDIKPK